MDSITNIIRVVAYLAVGGAILVVTFFAIGIYMYKKNQMDGE